MCDQLRTIVPDMCAQLLTIVPDIGVQILTIVPDLRLIQTRAPLLWILRTVEYTSVDGHALTDADKCLCTGAGCHDAMFSEI